MMNPGVSYSIRERLIPDFACESGVLPRSVAIVAPAFSGKTVLLRQIASAAALRGWTVVDVSPAADGLLPAVITQELNAAADEPPAPRLILIDDYHLIDSDENRRILELILRKNSHIRFVLASRVDPVKLLTAPRLRGEILDIDQFELAFTKDEAADFLQLTRADRKSEDFRLILHDSDGWILGLCQVRDWLARGMALGAARLGLSGTGGLVRDFIEHELLAGLSADDRLLLQRLSPFSVLSRDLVESLAGSNPGARLAVLVRQGLLREARDQVDTFSINALQRQYLEAELKDSAPGEWRDLLMRAAENYIAQNKVVMAVDCLLRLGAYDRASAILGEWADQAFASQGEVHEFFALCQRLPNEYAARFDRTFWIARGAVLAGSYGYAARLINELDHSPVEEAGSSERLEVIRILIALGYGQFDEVVKRGWPFLASLRAPVLDRAMVALALAQSCAATLDWAGNGNALERARIESAQAPTHYFHAWVTILSSMRLSAQGRLAEAVVELEKSLALPEIRGVIRHTTELMLANCRRLQGQFPDAERLIRRSFKAGARHGISETVITSLEAAAKLTLRHEGIEAALQLLTDADAWVARGFGDYCQRHLKLLRLDLLLRSSTVEHRQTIRWLFSEVDEWDQSGPPVSKALEERVRLLRARQHILQGESAAALNLVQPIIAKANSSGRMLVWGEASLLRIACMKNSGRSEAAFKALLAVLDVLVSLGAVGLILEHDYLLYGFDAELGNYLVSTQDSHDLPVRSVLKMLAESFRIETNCTDVMEEKIMNISLTDTELKILGHVAVGLRNQEIANRLLISLQTVKWHMHNIFSKMNVSNRISAVRRAQELLLIK